MPIRPATRSDLSHIFTLCSAAFFDEDLFGRVLHPHRQQYPEDVVLFWHGFVRDLWFNQRCRFWVSYEKGDGEEKVVGVGVWKRQGEGGKGMDLVSWDIRRILPPLSSLYTALTHYLHPSRALAPQHLSILTRSYPFIAHHWDGPRSEDWHLALLAVHPDHQGRGLGRELVAWGIEQADKERLQASVLSSEGKEEFYLKCGFDEVVGNAADGEGNPLAVEKVKGGSILFRWPRGEK
ncbi:acyl-CoA N-acyltransferase [Amniculicola lignicola CBS 123094]|uniref:Acyl-CoA N-acyltransferase n=1 Tax=Amniculicola lignicola CBS 123094 TaxID=1392246 RepID=A0A6A5WVG9_9PLEO|nr:acyl-CoA N-acyltransferase [Amniculicola lignicola CBS 123094]